MKGKLYVVSTPIGNVEDITYRAIKLLSAANYIVCEDVREARNLLSNYFKPEGKEIFPAHGAGLAKALELLESGKDVSLISDRGTPCLSDPGTELVSACHESGIEVVSVPGACAVAALMSIAGIGGRFMFHGFLPKKAIETVLDQLDAALDLCPVVFFESNHRIKSSLQHFLDRGLKIVVGRELTKKFEQVIRGDLTRELIDNLSDKGEYVFAVYR